MVYLVGMIERVLNVVVAQVKIAAGIEADVRHGGGELGHAIADQGGIEFDR